jgi:hypothetical protein
LFIFLSSSRFDFGAIGNGRSKVHLTRFFYMHLVSGECRLALVLYRLYLGLAKTVRWFRTAECPLSGATDVRFWPKADTPAAPLSTFRIRGAVRLLSRYSAAISRLR